MAHYHDETPLKPFPITISVRGVTLTFFSSPGIFSKDELDRGTAVLLESMRLPAQGSVLDLGCGYGVVGLVVGTLAPQLELVQSDVTQKAVTLARENAKRAKIETKVIKSDCYDSLGGVRFDVILVNPPRAAGKDVIRRMISEAPDHLVAGGSLQLVAMTNKGGKSYEKMMLDTFGNCEKIGRGSGFTVYCSVRE
jgi:16S rRNA G1207 methylase RsmC